MTTYSAISNTEVAPGQPAFASVMRRQRDNLKALAEGDPSVPVAERLTPGSFKPPTTASQTQILAHQGESQGITTADGKKRFFLAVVVVAGDYTFAGTRSSSSQNTVEIYINDVLTYTPSAAGFTQALSLSSGDRVRVDVERTTGAGTITLTDFRLLSEFVVPMAQCQFNRF